MRIIAGQFGGRRLRVPAGGDTRPTSDRVREALFSMLENRGVLADAHTLDLFAGSGSLSFEALSRGASDAVLIEQSKPAMAAIRQNISDLGLGARARVQATSAGNFLKGLPEQVPYDVIFLDPPYAMPAQELGEYVAALAQRVPEHATFVLERSKRNDLPQLPEGWSVSFDRNYGETTITLVERNV